ncbi:hypothetical protein MLD38_021594 [Melastoma candidum]|uniref:Uncharacterized protein n=1 Tax=Melastoma candidum TaxID=119954 RepID=A0ACB9QHI2_9MYRT|nr:hypothetical protein MLD38_021594 [Melastoma candidum]
MSDETVAGSPGSSPPAEGSSFIGPLLLCVMGIAVTSLALVAYHYVVVRCYGYRRHHDSKHMVGVDPKILGMIPVVAYRAKDRADDVCLDGGAVECTVCLGELEDGEMVRTLPGCGHTYHATCIDQWFGAHTSCPVCRTLVAEAAEEEREQRASRTTMQQHEQDTTSRGAPVPSVNVEAGTHHVAIDIQDENGSETASRQNITLMRSKSLNKKPTRSRSGSLSAKLIRRSLSHVTIISCTSNETIPR